LKTLVAISAWLVLGATLLAAQPAQSSPAKLLEKAKPAPIFEAAQLEDGIWIPIGPSKQLLPGGIYRFVFIPFDAAKQVVVTTIDATGGVTPPEPPVPDDTRAVLTAALAKVTDATKATTAAQLASIYGPMAVSAIGGKISTVEGVKTAVGTMGLLITAGKTGWADFNTALEGQVGKQPTPAAAGAVLQVAVDLLKAVK
jgi:hypothetical protein